MNEFFEQEDSTYFSENLCPSLDVCTIVFQSTPFMVPLWICFLPSVPPRNDIGNAPVPEVDQKGFDRLCHQALQEMRILGLRLIVE